MSGDAKRVPELTGKIEELGLDGAMIEVHCNPAAALSDKEQQVKPSAISHQLSAIRNLNAEGSKLNAIELNWLRAEIDELDDAIWETIAARMDVSRRIGEWKKAHGVAPLQPERFQYILEQRKQWAVRKGLPESFVEQIFESIHKQSLREQV
jgi:chorismate mutase